MENSNISLEEIQKSNLIIKAISSYYTSRIVGQRNLQISLLVSLIANGHNKKAEQLKNYSFVLVDNFNKIKSHEYNEWYKNYVSGDSGVWVGNGVGNQYLIKVSASYKSMPNNCGNSFGYLIKQENATMIKLLGMKEKGEEDE